MRHAWHFVVSAELNFSEENATVSDSAMDVHFATTTEEQFEGSQFSR
jgi:hypothetical protein